MPRPPEPGDEVVLRDQSGGAYRGEVTELASGLITVLMVEDRRRPFRMREKLMVTWPDGAGVTFLPVVLRDNPGPDLWVAEIVGEAWQEQRRQFLRAAIAATVALSPTAGSGVPDTQPAEGSLVDLSEAGLRCAVGSRREYLTTPTTPVTVRITMADLDLTLAGKILYGRPMARRDGMLEVVVVFDRPVPEADRLRALTRRSDGER